MKLLSLFLALIQQKSYAADWKLAKGLSNVKSSSCNGNGKL